MGSGRHHLSPAIRWTSPASWPSPGVKAIGAMTPHPTKVMDVMKVHPTRTMDTMTSQHTKAMDCSARQIDRHLKAIDAMMPHPPKDDQRHDAPSHQGDGRHDAPPGGAHHIKAMDAMMTHHINATMTHHTRVIDAMTPTQAINTMKPQSTEEMNTVMLYTT